MKTKAILILTALTLLVGGKSFAQMDDCQLNLSLFVEPAKAKNYEAALPYYEKLIKDCPNYNLATYQYAEKMFKHFIDQGDKSKINDLIKSYNLRLENFPAKTKQGEVLQDIAKLKYENEIGTKQEQFDAFNEAFTKHEEDFTSPKALYAYFSLAVDLYDEGKKDIQEVFDLYDSVTAKIEKEENALAEKLTKYMDKQDEGNDLSSKEKRYMGAYENNLKAYGQVKGSVNGKLGILADCDNLIPLYEKDFDSNKEDVNWLKRAAGRLSAKDCETPLFFKLVQQLHNLEPSAKSAYYLGQLADQDGKASKAMEYYNEAADLETEPGEKVKIYRRIADNFRRKGSYSQARTYYNKVLQIKPSDGRSYLHIATMYAKSANNCGTTPFQKRAINWKAAEMAEKAARVDASIASSANAAASSYRQRAPSKQDIFSEGMAGKTVTFSCWVGGSVRVPNL
ncbi:hypothetical protein INR76_06590 [Marixanthomonas sp. SCSIO 43207]|uniref:tetratricopeptide repeat protein n=1 Tax=Marixanthomonas sp. SCSIO 43207 TaxID=2779360 RepID=UPI001CA80905|nr:hypothetical protein [Marixanthomonas sp. SCSIO 43207]UAB82422.1 hypothetical protein INR76_06590 [Marixanthomonas sp. SCSIO 43207]